MTETERTNRDKETLDHNTLLTEEIRRAQKELEEFNPDLVFAGFREGRRDEAFFFLEGNIPHEVATGDQHEKLRPKDCVKLGNPGEMSEMPVGIGTDGIVTVFHWEDGRKSFKIRGYTGEENKKDAHLITIDAPTKDGARKCTWVTISNNEVEQRLAERDQLRDKDEDEVDDEDEEYWREIRNSRVDDLQANTQSALYEQLEDNPRPVEQIKI